MRKLTRLENDLSEDGILEIKDDIIEVAKQRVADRKKKKQREEQVINPRSTNIRIDH